MLKMNCATCTNRRVSCPAHGGSVSLHEEACVHLLRFHHVQFFIFFMFEDDAISTKTVKRWIQEKGKMSLLLVRREYEKFGRLCRCWVRILTVQFSSLLNTEHAISWTRESSGCARIAAATASTPPARMKSSLFPFRYVRKLERAWQASLCSPRCSGAAFSAAMIASTPPESPIRLQPASLSAKLQSAAQHHS